MTGKDEENPEGTSGSRWEPTEASGSEATAEQATAVDQPTTKARWRPSRPSRTLSIASAAALAGLVVGGLGGWAVASVGHGDDHHARPALVGFQHGSGAPDGDGRGPGVPGGVPGGGPFGGPGGPGVIPGQPQLGQGDDSDDGTDDGQQS